MGSWGWKAAGGLERTTMPGGKTTLPRLGSSQGFSPGLPAHEAPAQRWLHPVSLHTASSALPGPPALSQEMAAQAWEGQELAETSRRLVWRLHKWGKGGKEPSGWAPSRPVAWAARGTG